MNKNIELVEKLAAVEHEQWCSWSLSLSETEFISEDRKRRWRKLWVPYIDLPETEKDQDRRWAIKVLNILKEEKK